MLGTSFNSISTYFSVCNYTHLVTGDRTTGLRVAFGLTLVTHARGTGVLLPPLAVLKGYADKHLDLLLVPH